MSEEANPSDALSADVLDVIRSLVTAIRAVKLYPPNNPVYSQSVQKCRETLARFLETASEFRLGVQKSVFTYLHTPIGKDAQLNKAIAQDLFAKGIRDIVFCQGMTAKEMQDFFETLTLSTEEMAMKSGISSILWEKGVSNIKIIEAGLDEVITTKTDAGWAERKRAETPSVALDPSQAKEKIAFSGRTLVLGDLMTDPAGFGAGMVALAKKTLGEHEHVEDRLLALYQEAGRKIQAGHPDQSDTLFAGLAESALSLEEPYREALIAGKLYASVDSENVQGREDQIEEQVPNEYHEIVTGRFSNAWTAQQVAVLLKKSTGKKTVVPSPPPSSPDALSAEALPSDVSEIVRELAEYTPEEMEILKAMSGVGMESDIIEAAVRTLISLIPLVKNPRHAVPDDKEVALFAGVIHQLEDMQSYLLKKKDYDRASLITGVFHMPVEAEFKPRMMEALKKTASKTFINSTLADLRNCTKGSPEYASAYSYLASMEREATEVLLELVAEETDKTARLALLDILKDVGKNQIAMMGERLSDDRWYFVRNIVSVLGETQGEQALIFLQRAAEHKNVKIREEVLRGLITIGGKKAAGLLAKFFKDRDPAIQSMAIRGFTEIKGISGGDAEPLVTFLEGRSLSKRDQQLTLEAIRALGKVGSPAAEAFLKRYNRVRWWKSRQLQVELRVAAQRAMDEIKRRQVDGGPGKR